MGCWDPRFPMGTPEPLRGHSASSSFPRPLTLGAWRLVRAPPPLSGPRTRTWVGAARVDSVESACVPAERRWRGLGCCPQRARSPLPSLLSVEQQAPQVQRQGRTFFLLQTLPPAPLPRPPPGALRTRGGTGGVIGAGPLLAPPATLGAPGVCEDPREFPPLCQRCHWLSLGPRDGAATIPAWGQGPTDAGSTPGRTVGV